MDSKSKTKKGKKPRQSRPGKNISFEAAILMFTFIGAISDKAVVERGLKLALRGPDLLRALLWSLMASQGIDLRPLMSGEGAAPATRAEVKELVEPLLKRGAEMATIAQIADIFLFSNERSPENIVYAFYTGIRYAVARERMPTKEESGQIWEIALLIARTSKSGEPHWKELEERDPQALEDWIDERKEDARKKYQTFLGQKRKAEATAQKAFGTLMADLFGRDESEGPKTS